MIRADEDMMDSQLHELPDHRANALIGSRAELRGLAASDQNVLPQELISGIDIDESAVTRVVGKQQRLQADEFRSRRPRMDEDEMEIALFRHGEDFPEL